MFKDVHVPSPICGGKIFLQKKAKNKKKTVKLFTDKCEGAAQYRRPTDTLQMCLCVCESFLLLSYENLFIGQIKRQQTKR